MELEGTICQIGGMSPSPKSAGSDSVNEIATVRIELRDTDPLIWREAEVPISITLKVLHDVIQDVMGWFDYHLWEFTIGTQRYGLAMDEDWGTEPRKEAAKVRLRDVLKSRRTTIGYLYDFGDGWPDHADAREWADDYDPDIVDQLPIKYALARIANRRNAAKARLAKKNR